MIANSGLLGKIALMKVMSVFPTEVMHLHRKGSCFTFVKIPKMSLSCLICSMLLKNHSTTPALMALLHTDVCNIYAQSATLGQNLD